MTSIRNIAKTEFGSFNGLHWGQGIKIKTDTEPVVQHSRMSSPLGVKWSSAVDCGQEEPPTGTWQIL